MKIFLAGVRLPMFAPALHGKKFNGLLSFAADKLSLDKPLDWTHYKDFILDSGAFTFAFGAGARGDVDWEGYCRRYAAYVVKNRIKKYMELDVDKLVGYEKVVAFRRLLEKETGLPCIPVWHISRGLEEWKRMCSEYRYVAIGGIKSEIGRHRWKWLNHFIDEAHRRGAKVHGLGYTRASDFAKGIGLFDTVDSTTWQKTSACGTYMKFDGRRLRYIRPPAGKRINLTPYEFSAHALNEWIKYAEYMESI